MENQEKNKLKAWLDKIEQDSWQLELVVTAFSIFLVLGALDALDGMDANMRLLNEGMGDLGKLVSVSFGILAAALFFILINLVLHFVHSLREQACLFHTDKPLRCSAENNGRFMTPAVRVAVSDIGLFQQRAFFSQQRQDAEVAFVGGA